MTGRKEKSPGVKLPSLSVVLLLLLRGTSCVQVLEFQKDGVATFSTVAEYPLELDRSRRMDSVTLCARFKIFFLHSRAAFFQLWDRVDNFDGQLKGEIWLNRVRPVIAHRYKFQLLKDKLRAYRWYHLCFTYDHLTHRYSTYVNGELVYGLTYDVGRQVYGDYARLGQSKDVFRTFSGALSQVNVWDYPLSAEVIAEAASCRSDPQGNYISWEVEWTLTNVSEYDVPLEHFCRKHEASTYFWFPKLPQHFGFYICEALGTHLPLPETIEDVHFWFNLSSMAWPEEPVLCRDDFWVSLVDADEEGQWVTHYDGVLAPRAAWKDGEPNGIFYENCAKIEPEGIADINCLTNLRCAVCEFTETQIYSLLGTCERELRNVHFLAYQEGLGDLLFRGYGEYQIRRVGDEWRWINVVQNTTLARLDADAPMGMPMGRRLWHLEDKVCDQSRGTRMLVLTPCPEGSYTCDDATCIDLEYRCDLKYDCLDRSDEADCELVGKADDYKRDLPPRLGDKGGAEGLPVTLGVSVESAAIDTTRMTMQLSYEVRMTWFDGRLMFRNLKGNDSLNKVPLASMEELWSPTVGFVNAEGHPHTTVDEETTLHLQRMQHPTRRDSGAPGEVDLFSGVENPLIIARKYSTTFICDFNLVLYPFDVQHCDMHLRILSASRSYLVFDEVATAASYYGSELLLEYQLEQPQLLYDNNIEYVEMRVRIPLQRRPGYAILNIYTPSLILLLISYLSLFFRPRILEVRVMTTLTSLLVMATLFTQVSASLPKTSYFKMVDVWLIFCIVVSFLIIIFHTVIDSSLGATPGTLPQPTKVMPLAQGGKDFEEVSAGLSEVTKAIILASRSIVFGLCLLFNLIYWSYIFG